ncbi:MAG: ABC-F family ATP-binding cassette domain-containing protein [Parachlamydiaceae bacterium]|nr:ABC-F family ATP-binding cassette domain-containing protein [Parachlamydiaceae bacterium]
MQVDSLSMGYHGLPLFEEATFSIQEGERCALVGRNGSGKTTLFRILTGEERPDEGSVVLRKNYKLGILKQHIKFTESTILEEAALALPVGDEDALHKAEKILFGLGFKDEQMYLDPQQLSGGFQLRLNLAKVLIAEPDCLLLDEPTNYLDIISIAWFTRFLQQWKGEFVLISHDREFLDSVATHTMGIHRQRVRKVKGGTVEFYDKILQEEEIHARTAENLDKKRAHLQSFIDRFGAKASKATQAQSKAKALQRIPTLEKLKDLYQLDFHFNEAFFPGKKMLSAENLYFSYTPEVKIVENFSLDIEKDEHIAIIGKNGRGKSTILRILAGDLSPLGGSVKRWENLSIGYFGQTNIQRLHPQNTIEEEIWGANPKLNRTEVKRLCGLMMFSGDQAEKRTAVLSGGEKSRVLLGKILASPCNLLLLDEPTHHLDMESIEALIDALEEFQGSVVMVTHSELILKRLQLDRIVICHEGRQETFLGDYETFLEKHGWDEPAYGKTKKKNVDQRDSKQQRAEMINERSKALKPIDQEIAKLEKLIATLEAEQEADHVKLLNFSGKGEKGSIIQEMSKASSQRTAKIQGHTITWEALMAERAKVEAKFS